MSTKWQTKKVYLLLIIIGTLLFNTNPGGIDEEYNVATTGSIYIQRYHY